MTYLAAPDGGFNRPGTWGVYRLEADGTRTLYIGGLTEAVARDMADYRDDDLRGELEALREGLRAQARVGDALREGVWTPHAVSTRAARVLVAAITHYLESRR